MKLVHAEIEYLAEDGTKIHSDICPKDCDPSNLTKTSYKRYLHDYLEEWLNKSKGTCGFYIRDENYIFDCERQGRLLLFRYVYKKHYKLRITILTLLLTFSLWANFLFLCGWLY